MNLKCFSRLFILTTLVTMLVFLLAPQHVLAEGVVGNGTADSCTEAALDAALAGGGNITFNCGSGPVTITVTNYKTIAANTSIDGGGKITLSGGNSRQVLYVNSGVSLALSNLIVANGWSGGSAGGIYNNGIVTITNSTLSGNSGDWGGAIENNLGTLTIIDSTFSGNTAWPCGGAICNYYGTVTITRSSFSNNSAWSGGAIGNYGGSLTITNSTFLGNSASSSGWGGGGAVYTYSGGTMTATNSTFSGNSAVQSGGSIRVDGGATVLRNTIIAGSTTEGNCYGTITNGGNNIDDGTTCGWASNNGSMSNTDPKLAALADNGGPTYTMALLVNSPALGAANPSYCPTADQRGVTRPQPTGTICDIGAYESNLISTYSISGRVINGSGNGISSMSISGGAGHTTTTDGSGNYTLSELAAGTYTISPSKSGYTFSPSSRAVSVPPNKTGYDFVAIPLTPTCTVPFFSQRDERWINHPLPTNGACSSACGTIGACGCTLTSAAMVFSYYGANLNPPALSDCMGTSSCPFSWGTGASCTNGKATFVGKYGFSWSRLDQELNQNHRPVILGMHKKGNSNDTHWVVVISGQGSDPANYIIDDPWFLGGANMKLSARTRSYDLDSLSVYSGQPSCSGTSSATLRTSVMPQAILPVSSSIVIGTALIYSITDVTMTVQLVAQSSAGNITEMLVWTDEITNPSWQPFSTLIELPVSDHAYARFRDEFSNESGQTSDTIYPINTPFNPLLNIFLPIILK